MPQSPAVAVQVKPTPLPPRFQAQQGAARQYAQRVKGARHYNAALRAASAATGGGHATADAASTATAAAAAAAGRQNGVAAKKRALLHLCAACLAYRRTGKFGPR